MGYTHYWYQKKNMTDAEWVDLAKDVFKIIAKAMEKEIFIGKENSGSALSNHELLNWRDQVISKKERSILFNGVDGEDCETFCLFQKKTNKSRAEEFNFCKTARYPYDTVAVAILCVMKQKLPGHFKISSDGEREEWEDGKNLACEALGETIEIPELV